MGGGGLPAPRSAANGREGATSGGGPMVSAIGARPRQAPRGARAGPLGADELPPGDGLPEAAADGDRCVRPNGHGSRMLP
jgi:hypothetical protein